MSRRLRFRQALLSVTVALPLCGLGCARDYEAEIDAKVTQKWMQPGMYVDAVEYLESGGHYYDGDDIPGNPDLDSEAIVPFLKDLKQEFGQQQYAILVEDDDHAWSIVMKLPLDTSDRQRFEDYLESSRESFPGMILEEWGHEWITFHFLDEEQAEFVREAEAAAEAAS